MNWLLLIGYMGCIFAFTVFAFRVSIPLSLKLGWVEHPTSRRRHSKPMPIVGGVTIIFCWCVSLAGFFLYNSEWSAQYFSSICTMTAAVAAFCVLGMVDDLKGLRPVVKLCVEFMIAAFVIWQVKEIHDFCLSWKGRIGIAIWPLSALWLVGIPNAINLVDGLDGLAGGSSLLIGGSLAFLASKWGMGGDFTYVLVLLLLPCLGAFLLFNWNPAKVFLGDNGSLPIGFLLGMVSLIGPIESRSSTQFASLIFMMGYPILDMSLCVYRRLWQKNPIFKADRNHLHHRLLRMGLKVPQVVLLILSLTFYLQLCAFCLIEFLRAQEIQANPNLYWTSILFLSAVGFSLFSLLYLLRMTESTRVDTLQSTQANHIGDDSTGPRFKECLVAKIHLEPLFEAGLFEERARIGEVVSSLNLMIKSFIDKQDIIYVNDMIAHIVFTKQDTSPENEKVLHQILREKLVVFQSLFGIQYSAHDLKITFCLQECLLDKESHSLVSDDRVKAPIRIDERFEVSDEVVANTASTAAEL